MIKKLISIFTITCFLGCSSMGQRISTRDIDVTINTKKALQDTKGGKYFLTIKNSRTGTEWKLTYDEWETMVRSYNYWKEVSTQTPRISEIKEDKDYLYIVFNYHDKSGDNVGFRIGKSDPSILSGKVLVSKKYLVQVNSQTKNIYVGFLAGSIAYSILITIALAIVLGHGGSGK